MAVLALLQRLLGKKTDASDASPIPAYFQKKAEQQGYTLSDGQIRAITALTALDADLIKTYVRAGLGVGLLAEMAVSATDTDLRAWAAPAEVKECIAWAVLPRERVLRDYALDLVRALAPQIDRRDLRRVIDGNQDPDWPEPPTWQALTQTITS